MAIKVRKKRGCLRLPMEERSNAFPRDPLVLKEVSHNKKCSMEIKR